jgi:hypothetical protein
MSAGLVTMVTLAYLGVAADQISKGNFPMGLVWLGYAIANVGFIWDMAK